MDEKTDITIKDVAEHAGVAISTVSRVINGLDRVSEQTRQKVFHAVDELGYQPNISAKTLKAKRSEAIGFICDDITSPFVPQIIRGIEKSARSSCFNVILCNSDWNQNNTIRHLNMLQNRNIDGIIFSTPMMITEPLLGKLKKIKEDIPLILISDDNMEDGFNRVDQEVENGMKMIMEHLFKLGHKRISMIAGPDKTGVNALKVESYESIMRDKDLEDYIRCEYTEYSIEKGATAAKKLLDVEADKRPTAIFGSVDICTIGALQAVKNAGFKVPEDISLVGWGGIDFIKYTDPPITTIDVPRYELGKTAAEYIIKEIGNKTLPGVKEYKKTLPVKLLANGSTGPCP